MLSGLAPLIKSRQEEIVLAIAVVLISLISFQIGRLSISHFCSSPDIEFGSASQANIFSSSTDSSKINDSQPLSAPEQSHQNSKINFQVVASKNSDKYHFLWCPGAKSIKESNRLYFASEEEAQAKGYVLAGNCKK